MTTLCDRCLAVNNSDYINRFSCIRFTLDSLKIPKFWSCFDHTLNTHLMRTGVPKVATFRKRLKRKFCQLPEQNFWTNNEVFWKTSSVTGIDFVTTRTKLIKNGRTETMGSFYVVDDASNLLLFIVADGFGDAMHKYRERVIWFLILNGTTFHIDITLSLDSIHTRTHKVKSFCIQ